MLPGLCSCWPLVTESRGSEATDKKGVLCRWFFEKNAKLVVKSRESNFAICGI